jgi:hypothetical protein
MLKLESSRFQTLRASRSAAALQKSEAPNRKIGSLPTTELIIECSQLQKVGRHRRECGRQLRAYRRHRTDDDNGNECGNETIFNGGRAGLVIHKSGKQLH